MTPDDVNPKDLIELASAVPEAAWKDIVKTACETFEKFVSPITETTYGVGRLIQAKFDELVDIKKVYAADNVRKAQDKVKRSRKRPTVKLNAPVILAAIDASSYQTDETIRNLWANLLAQEIVTGNVHPEFVRILSRMSTEDAQLLVNLARRNKNVDYKQILKIVVQSFPFPITTFRNTRTFNHELLRQLNLIERDDNGIWYVTQTGWEFLKVVTDPSLELAG